MTDFTQVRELETKEYFRVLHHRLEVPFSLFTAFVGCCGDTVTESDAQKFIAAYLTSTGRVGGLVGMVRSDVRDASLLLDAAVRYPACAVASEKARDLPLW